MIQNKFETITIDSQIYVKVSFINDLYRTLPRKSGTTQLKIVDELQLDKHAAVWRRNKDKSKLGTVATRFLNQFKSQSQDIYVDVREIMTPKEGPHKSNHIRLLQMINDQPDLNTESDSESDSDEPTTQAAAAPITNNTDRVLMPIIELEEHEMFRDANDQVFSIEVRGERSKDKILFKAKDVAVFAENNRLLEILLRDQSLYVNEKDYKILQEGSIPLLVGSNSSANGRGINHDLVYLTLAGLIRVVTVSRNANANLLKLFDWLQNLFYVHQFGSHEERNELAQDILKTILNDRMSGLYCIDLGTFNDLYDTMNISRETYPPETYGNYHLYKYGLSKDISTRLTQHQNKKDGYGRWSTKVSLKWMVLLSDSQLSEGEGLLAEKFKAKGLSFAYTDESSKAHNELIMVSPRDESKVKTIYKQTVSYFPSKENSLCKLIAEMQVQHELDLLKLEYNYSKQLTAANESTTKAQYETQLIKVQYETQLEIQSLKHQNELLQMQQKLSKLNLT
jgi:hypothetical protein